MNNLASPAQLIIAAMISPALLILGSASLVATALVRLARAVDRARTLMLVSPEDAAKYGWTDALISTWIERYAERSMVAERAVTALFGAVGTFVLACLTIAIDHYFHNHLTWLPVGLTVLGMFFILLAAYYMVRESHLSTMQIREELQELRKK